VSFFKRVRCQGRKYDDGTRCEGRFQKKVKGAQMNIRVQ
jgi:hypothetical protein